MCSYEANDKIVAWWQGKMYLAKILEISKKESVLLKIESLVLLNDQGELQWEGDELITKNITHLPLMWYNIKKNRFSNNIAGLARNNFIKNSG